MGERLARLAEKVQVMVVTHSPQVAAFGSEHFKVEKTTQNDITTTRLEKLTAAGKVEEIARMLAGEKITKEARAAAHVLLNKDKTRYYFNWFQPFPLYFAEFISVASRLHSL